MMTVGRMTPGAAPAVQRHGDDAIAVWAGEGDGTCGIVFDAAVGAAVALQILQLTAEMQGEPIRPAEDFAITWDERNEPTEMNTGRLTITIDGAPLAIDVPAQDLAEMAAGLSASARRVG